MRWLRLIPTLVLACVLLGGCGDDERSPGKSGKAGQAAPAAPIDDWHVLMTFAVDLEGARKAGHVRPDADADEVFERVVEVTRERVRAAELGAHWVKARGDRRFEVGFAKLAKERHDEVVALVTRAGTLEFRIEVKTDEAYRRHLDPGDDPPKRKGLWKGSAVQFAQFIQSESEILQRALATGQRYVPSYAAFRLAREAGKDGSDPSHFHLLEVPAAAETFNGDMLRRPKVAVDFMDHPVVVFEVEEARQKAFGDWTEKNKHLPLAILLDGAYHSAPTIRARLTTHVQVSLGTRGSRAAMLREARALAAALQAGAIPVQPTLVSIDTR